MDCFSDVNALLDISEMYMSVQGESSFQGLPTFFIRLSGCHMRCAWCDTSHAFERGSQISIREVLHEISSQKPRYVCITGGEPLLQKDVLVLIKKICDANIIVTIETSGSISIAQIDPRAHIILDIKCPGSNMDHANLLDNLRNIKGHDEIKFVIASKNDYNFAKETCQQFNLYDKANYVLFSPAFEILTPAELAQWVLADNLPVRLNLQMHKYIWSPNTIGV